MPENSAAGTNVGDPVVATDSDVGDTITYSLSGADAGSFEIGASTGQITVKDGTDLDHENEDSYTVIVTATDTGSLTDTVTVNISVTNVDEPGRLTVTGDPPVAGNVLTATVTDDDDPMGINYMWSRSDNRTGPYTAISGASNMTYTPGPDDVGRWLKLDVSYADPHGSPMLEWTASAAVDVRTFVSNLTETATTPADRTVPTTSAQSQAFLMTTDSSKRFVITGVCVALSGIGSGDEPVVSLYHAARDGRPNPTVMAVLDNPATVTDGVNCFTAPEAVVVPGNELLAAVVDADAGSFEVDTASSNSQSGDTGWAIAADRYGIGSGTTTGPYTNEMRISVHGYEDPGATLSDESKLKSLTVSYLVGGTKTTATLSPVFDSATTTYRARVPAGTEVVTFEAMPSHDDGYVLYPANDFWDLDRSTAGYQRGLPTTQRSRDMSVTGLAQDLSSQTTYTLSISRDLTVQFGPGPFSADEGSSVNVTVTLSEAPGETVEIPIDVSETDATAADYRITGLNNDGELVFDSGDRSKVIAVEVIDDTANDDNESITLSFGSPLPDDVGAVSPTTATVHFVDDDGVVVPTVQWASATYDADEGDSVNVVVEISTAQSTPVVIPLSVTRHGDASPGDYSGINDSDSVTIPANSTSAVVRITVVDDSDDDDNESIRITFGNLPSTVTRGTPDTTTVRFGDDDEPANRAPRFSRPSVSFTVTEDTSGGTVLGTVAAGDPDMDTLEYSLSGDDAASFRVSRPTAVISVAPGVTFVHATKATYRFTLTATDDEGLTGTVAVTVRVADPNPAGSNQQGAVHAGVAKAATTHQIGPSGHSWHSVMVTEGRRYRFTVDPRGTDNIESVTVRSAGNVRLAEETSPDGGQYVITWTADRTSTVYLRVSGGATQYLFTVRSLGTAWRWNHTPDRWDGIDVPANNQTAALVLVNGANQKGICAGAVDPNAATGGRYVGTLDFADDTGFIAVHLKTNTRYWIMLEVPGGSTLTEPFIRSIHGPGGGQLHRYNPVTNNYTPVNTSLRGPTFHYVKYNATRTGVHYIAAHTAFDTPTGTTGAYRLSIYSIVNGSTNGSTEHPDCS